MAEFHATLCKVTIACTQNFTSNDPQFEVSGFPTLKWISEDGTSDFEGGRDKQALINFIEGKTGGAEDYSEANFKKMRVKQLKNFLKSRGVACGGCTEKHEFVAEVHSLRE